jgi:hypothetical protein
MFFDRREVIRSGITGMCALKETDPVDVRSEAWALSARTLDRGFKCRLGMDVCPWPFCVVLSSAGRGLATSWSLVQGVLPFVVKYD